MIVQSSPHSQALAQLMPLEMDAEQNAVAFELDRAVAAIRAAWAEVFPGSALATFERWEALYDLSGTGTDEDRRAALMAAYNADVGISQRHYAALALAMGHSVAIKPPKRMCRVGASHAGQRIWNHEEQWTWTVRTPLSQTAAAKLVETFEAEKIPFTAIRWVFGFIPLLTVSGENVLTVGGARVLLEAQD